VLPTPQANDWIKKRRIYVALRFKEAIVVGFGAPKCDIRTTYQRKYSSTSGKGLFSKN
jgi:hypothetical protein